MDIRPITENYAVSPQIAPDELPEIKAAGYRTIVCNRPDDEVPDALSAKAIASAAEAAGLAFYAHPMTHQTMDDCVPRQMEILSQAQGPVLAYCASGTRCSIAWSLGHAGTLSADEIIAATRRAGYDLAALRPRLELAERS